MARSDSLILLDRASAAYPQLELNPDTAGVAVRLLDSPLEFFHSFIRGPLAQRARQPDQALLRACRGKQRNISSVLDLTAGWGADALALAYHGQRVRLLEQNAVIFAIIAHGLACLAESTQPTAPAQRLRVKNVNALDYLNVTPAGEYDCIYIDPMFPAHKSGAKPGKAMQILQALTDNLDIEACFELARARAGKRVVIKRPAKAGCLGDMQADLVYREKSVRFDVYLSG